MQTGCNVAKPIADRLEPAEFAGGFGPGPGVGDVASRQFALLAAGPSGGGPSGRGRIIEFGGDIRRAVRLRRRVRGGPMYPRRTVAIGHLPAC